MKCNGEQINRVNSSSESRNKGQRKDRLSGREAVQAPPLKMGGTYAHLHAERRERWGLTIQNTSQGERADQGWDVEAE